MRQKQSSYPWERLSDERLLDLRFCDLKLRIEDSPLADLVQRLHRELERRALHFRPHVWFSDEWFSPTDIPGIAVPFFLGHSRLTKLEDTMMLEVEGGTPSSCMRLLRHEAGHAIDTAFVLHRRKEWKKHFGNPAKPYPDSYRPKPGSRKHVLHLDWWYAQSHPYEDFAETFAVWLRPGSNWRRQYAEWRVYKKLLYVDALMTSLADTVPRVRSRKQYHRLSTNRQTLREYYQEKRNRYSASVPEVFDRDLRRLFAEPAHTRKRSSAAFLRKHSSHIRNAVTRVTGEPAYSVDHVIREMTARCKELRLIVNRPDELVRTEVAVLVSSRIVDFIHDSGRMWIPL